jgi:hypothetical protein
MILFFILFESKKKRVGWAQRSTVVGPSHVMAVSRYWIGGRVFCGKANITYKCPCLLLLVDAIGEHESDTNRRDCIFFPSILFIFFCKSHVKVYSVPLVYAPDPFLSFVLFWFLYSTCLQIHRLLINLLYLYAVATDSHSRTKIAF